MLRHSPPWENGFLELFRQKGSPLFGRTFCHYGNILSISDGTNTTSYVYDTANQLVRENNQAEGYTHTWTYNDAGNILNRKEYAYTSATTLGTPTKTVTYTYANTDWGDLLMAYDGQAITYDTIGNPLTDGTRTYTWQHGRQLASLTENGTTWNYTYNADGLRTKRTNGTTIYSYVYNGDKLAQMIVGGNTLYFGYDASGKPLTVTYNNTTYYYVGNIQGDVLGILDSSGTAVVTYSYDAWGNILETTGTMASTLGFYNPLRYRSYVYDQESGLYYLQSRYYNPKVGRFLNADAQLCTTLGLLGTNQFAYCLNNPVNLIDFTGKKPGDYFSSIDEAAKDAALYMGPNSFLFGWEYITSIYSVEITTYRTYREVSYSIGYDGSLHVSVRVKIAEYKLVVFTYSYVHTDYNPTRVLPYLAPDGHELKAFVHTHPLGSGEGITKVSNPDKELAKDYNVFMYVYGPNGELHRYDPTEDDIEIFEGLPKARIKHWKYYKGAW